MSRALLAALAVAAVAAGASSWDARCRRWLEAASTRGFSATDLPELATAVATRGVLSHREALDAWVMGAAASAQDPLVAAAVEPWAAQLDLEAGRPERARARFVSAGGVTRWWAWGPVPIEELDDVGSLQPPPAGARWRQVPGTDPLGWVRVSGLAWPGARQVVYLGAHLLSELEQPVAVRVGAAEAARVWVNGRLVLTTPYPLRRGPDQHAAGAWLRPGSNALVVAVAVERGEWWARVRVTDPHGAPVRLAAGGGPPPAVAAVDRDPPAVHTLRAALTRAAQEEEPRARLALAALLVERRPDPVDSGQARAAAVAARADDPVLARWLQSLVETQPDTRRDLLQSVLRLDPDFLPARLAWSHWLAEHGLWLAARDVLRGSSEPAAVATLADLAVDRWGALALPDLVRAAADAPRCVRAQRLAGGRLVDEGMWPVVRSVAARLSTLVPGAEVTRSLADRLSRAEGDQDKLLESARQELKLDPNHTGVRRKLARLLVAAGRYDEAREVLAEGVSVCPSHPDLAMDLAELEHQTGDDAAARSRVARVLEARPQDRRAQRLAALLGQVAQRPDWVRDPADLGELQGAATGPYVGLLDHHEVQLLPHNLVEERVQRVWRVRDPERAEPLRRLTVSWVPERERLTVVAARVVRASGTPVDAEIHDTPRLAEREFNLFYDTRLRVFEMPPLEAGDLVELTYVRSESAESNDTGAYRGGIVPLAGPVPFALAELSLEGPVGGLPAHRVVGLEDRPQRSVHGGRERLFWRWRQVAAVPADTPPPPGLTATPYFVYSTHPDWKQLGAWYARHIEPRIRPGTRTAEKARELTRGAGSRRERIERIYRFVADRIRYVGLEFGEHRFRPFSAEWVLAHRMGDCKDKASLLVALLREVGIPARVVLVRTADLGPAPSGVATLEAFNHAIAYLPEDDLWLDGTATGQAVDALPGPDRGAAVLVAGSGVELETTPAGPAGRVRRRVRIARSGSGFLDVHLEHDAWGDPATGLRSALGGTRDPRRLERWVQQWLPGAALAGEPATHLEPGSDPATVHLDVRLPVSALEAAGGLTLYPGRVRLVQRLVPMARRNSPLLVPAEPIRQWRITVDLGRAPRRLPPPVELSGPFGEFALSVTATAEGYVVKGRLELQAGLVEAKDVPAFRDFLLEVERAAARKGELP